MNASIVPTVTLRADGTYAVAVAPNATIVWEVYDRDGVPTIQVKVEQPGVLIYEQYEGSNAIAVRLD
jgi:hypothetical protein